MSAAESAQYWDQQYASDEYLSRWNRQAPTHDLPAMICAGFIQRDSTVLDLGCGTGTDAIYFAKMGLKTIGVDLSRVALEIAAKRAQEAGVEVDWRQASVLDLPIPDGSIEFVADAGCFHHLGAGERMSYVAEVYRVLRPGSKLLLRWGEIPGRPSEIDGPMLNRCFPSPQFSRGPIINYDAASDASPVQALMVLIEKTSCAQGLELGE